MAVHVKRASITGSASTVVAPAPGDATIYNGLEVVNTSETVTVFVRWDGTAATTSGDESLPVFPQSAAVIPYAANVSIIGGEAGPSVVYVRGR